VSSDRTCQHTGESVAKAWSEPARRGHEICGTALEARIGDKEIAETDREFHSRRH